MQEHWRLTYADVEPDEKPSETVLRESTKTEPLLLKSSLFTALCNEFEDGLEARAFLRQVATRIGRPVFLNAAPAADGYVKATTIFAPVEMSQSEVQRWSDSLTDALVDAGLLQ